MYISINVATESEKADDFGFWFDLLQCSIDIHAPFYSESPQKSNYFLLCCRN